MRPTYSTIIKVFDVGDEIWVLTEDENYAPVRILSIERTYFKTDVGKILFEDHGWLWWCFKH